MNNFMKVIENESALLLEDLKKKKKEITIGSDAFGY